jgi:hypothetical protein
MDQDEVVDISSIILRFQSFLHECVELVHIDIGEELTRQIADRESTSRSSIKQALVARESDPVHPISGDNHSLTDISE